jgi:hypothetical protein
MKKLILPFAGISILSAIAGVLIGFAMPKVMIVTGILSFASAAGIVAIGFFSADSYSHESEHPHTRVNLRVVAYVLLAVIVIDMNAGMLTWAGGFATPYGQIYSMLIKPAFYLFVAVAVWWVYCWIGYIWLGPAVLSLGAIITAAYHILAGIVTLTPTFLDDAVFWIGVSIALYLVKPKKSKS